MRYLCLHGFTGSPETFGAFQLPPGSLAPVLGGHLHTAVRGDFEDEVERLAELAAEAGCDALFGYSLGGRFALGILARFPDRFRHALVASAQAGLVSAEERRARHEADQRWVDLLRERGLTAFVDAWQALPLWASQADLPEATKRAQREQRLRHAAPGLAASLLQHGLGEMPDLRPFLGRVRTRVDLLVGARDQKFVTLAQELSTLIPDARLSVAPDAGHNLLLERPALCESLLVEGEDP
ncbi:MAG: alpha/beta hydrolase fold protein [Polyangiaceae bacterium]|nr:alpha/beta hydrolase fold protein [Polyangiaceae bacterium]